MGSPEDSQPALAPAHSRLVFLFFFFSSAEDESTSVRSCVALCLHSCIRVCVGGECVFTGVVTWKTEVVSGWVLEPVNKQDRRYIKVSPEQVNRWLAAQAFLFIYFIDCVFCQEGLISSAGRTRAGPESVRRLKRESAGLHEAVCTSSWLPGILGRPVTQARFPPHHTHTHTHVHLTRTLSLLVIYEESSVRPAAALCGSVHTAGRSFHKSFDFLSGASEGLVQTEGAAQRCLVSAALNFRGGSVLELTSKNGKCFKG